MAKNSTKRTPKQSSSITAKPSSAKTQAPPEPFSLAPEAAAPFLAILDPKHVYITHVDRFPAAFKKRIFAVPLILNLTIAALLLWRIWVQLPWYCSLLLTIWGYDSETTVDRSKYTNRELGFILLKRTGTFMIDFLLARFIFPWAYTFFFEGGGNPTDWRLSIGFRDREIYVRKSRSFTAEDLISASTQGRKNPFFTVRIVPAVDAQYIKEKTGYLHMGADWDLDFGVMVVAENQADKKVVPRQYFERSVWIHCGEQVGWARWDVDEEEGSADDEEFLHALAKQVAKERGEEVDSLGTQ